MIKIFFYCLLLLMLPEKIFSQSSPDTKIRTTLKFNKDWKFILEDKTGFESTLLDDAEWRSLDLPHDWGVEGKFNQNNPAGGNGAFLPTGIGWYRKIFVLPDSLKGKRIVIQFDGIYMNSKVYINGHFLGQYPYGYSSFQYDLTEFIKAGEKNTIAVRVDNSLQPASRWYAGSGIYRNVWLIATNQIHFDNYAGVFVSYPSVNKAQAVVKLQYKITANAFKESDFQWWRRNTSSNKRITKEVTITSTILTANGTEVAREITTEKVGDFNEYDFAQTFSIKNPQLWSTDTPSLYTLKTKLVYDGRLIDDYSTTIGIRKVEFTPEKGMLVNGVPEKIKGVCLHQDAGSIGVAVPIGVWQNRLERLKQMGCNAIRLSHHPFAPEFYDLCDRMGFYIMDEAFDEWNKGYPWGTTENTYGKMPYSYHLYFNQWAETDLRAMIRRDRNHPAVIMYSIGNEIPNQRTPDGTELVKKLQNICHDEDPTRLVTSAVDFIEDANLNGFLSLLDIAGYNYIDRYNGNAMYTPEREKYSKRLLLGTETFHHTANWLAVRDHDYIIGEFVWVGYDYLGEAGNWPQRGWDAGIIDMAGHRRPEYYLRKSYWSKDPVVHIAIETAKSPEGEWHPRKAVSHWNHKWNGGYLLPIYIYSNCDEVELSINDSIIGKKTVDKNLYYAKWELPYKAGKVKATGYIKGKIATLQQLLTAGVPSAIQLKTTTTKLKANGEDIALIDVFITDENGTIVPDAQQELIIAVTGSAKLIGIDNGNQSDVQNFKENKRKAFEGHLLITLQSTEKLGDIKLEVKGSNLQSAIINIPSLK